MDQDAAQVRWLVVDSEQTGQRLDNWLTSRLKGAPRSLIYRIIRSGEVRVNRGRAQAATRLATGDVIRLPPLQLAAASPAPVIGEALARSLPPRILYREGGLILLDKPAGLAVHGGSGLQYGVIEALRQALDRPDLELIHRLDRETSGLLMIAEKRSTLRLLQEYLREGKIRKTYQALAKGHWDKSVRLVDLPLQRVEMPHGERRVRVQQDGKPSQTRFQCLGRFGQGDAAYSWLACSPLTGRTHQIRVHALAMEHPLLGDDKYGHDVPFTGAVPGRLALHAWRLLIPGYPAFESAWPAPLDRWTASA